MTKPHHAEAGRVTAESLALAAKEGVARALAARHAMTELTPEQTQEVSGAAIAATATIKPPKEIIYGKIVRPPIIYGLMAPDSKQLEAATVATTKL